MICFFGSTTRKNHATTHSHQFVLLETIFVVATNEVGWVPQFATF